MTKHALATTFWHRAEKITAGMLAAGTAPPRPMSHTLRPEDPALWFITAAGTDIAEAARSKSVAQYTLACGHANLYATVDGTVEIVTDQDKLDEIWSPMAAAWFEDGRADDDIRLIRFTPTQAEVWATDGTAKTLYEMAKATGSKGLPDTGEHGTVVF